MGEIEFGPVFLTIVISLIGYFVSVLFGKLNQNYIPESGGWILAGIIMAFIWGAAPVYPYLFPPPSIEEYQYSRLQSQLTFHEEIFAKIFLPIIIFEAGWSLTGHSLSVFLHSFFQIGSLAVGGTIISMFVTFGCIMGLIQYGLTILDYKVFISLIVFT
jgi:NhaP-type Na+/H+ or K+/H+ antiporter